MATPSNRVPVRIARGLKAALDAAVLDLKEGEIVYAKDENRVYIVEGGVLTPATGASEIDGLLDVDTSTVPPTDGQILVWDNATSKWVPGDVAQTLDDLTDVDLTTTPPTSGQALVWNGTNWVPGTRVTSNTTQAGTGSLSLTNMVRISQANYDALGTKDSNTLYVIV